MTTMFLPSVPLIHHQVHCSCIPKFLSSSSRRLRSERSLSPENVHRRLKFTLNSSTASISLPDRHSESHRDPISGSKSKQKQVTIAGVIQDELLDPEHLAEPESRFCEFQGVKIHHQLSESSTSPSSHKNLSPAILLHGFGASVFSWQSAMNPLSQATNSSVLAFDRPGFGLTSRVDSRAHMSGNPSRINPYSMAFSVLLTLHFIDSLTSDKAILIGHSAGCLVAVNTYFKAPQRIAALILVAPAIIAPGKAPNQTKTSQNIFFKFFSSIAKTTVVILKIALDYGNLVYKKSLSFLLNSSFFVVLIRIAIDKFGVSAVRNAWYDRSKISDEVIRGYLKPLKVKGWDKGLSEFISAMVGVTEPEDGPSFAERIRGISCPVLIITGDSDRLVPAWNAKKLSEVIPGSSFGVIEQCGHLPHEEKVGQFVSAVSRFLQERL